MTKALKRNATYADLYGIPEHSVGEIVGGELYASPRPANRHAFSASVHCAPSQSPGSGPFTTRSRPTVPRRLLER